MFHMSEWKLQYNRLADESIVLPSDTCETGATPLDNVETVTHIKKCKERRDTS